MPKPVTDRAKSAPIKRQGHTTDGEHGSDPNLKSIGVNRAVRDLKPNKG